MTPETHSQLANSIWSICNLLRGPYKRNEYRKVILPLTVLRRFDCLLAPTKAKVLERHAAIKAKPESVVRSLLEKITGRPFFNLSKLDIPKLLDDPNQLAPNLNGYINGFSKNVREIMERLIKAVLNAIGERDETAEVCLDKNGDPEPDQELRDTESVPLKESIEAYFRREVLPHVPDAWIDHSKTKVGYEIPLNRHFYRYEPPRPLDEIEADIKVLEGEIMALLKEVTS